MNEQTAPTNAPTVAEQSEARLATFHAGLHALLAYLIEHADLPEQPTYQALASDQLSSQQLSRLNQLLRQHLLERLDCALFRAGTSSLTNEQRRIGQPPIDNARQLHGEAAGAYTEHSWHDLPKQGSEWGQARLDLQLASTHLDLTPASRDAARLYRALHGAELLTQDTWTTGALDRILPLIPARLLRGLPAHLAGFIDSIQQQHPTTPAGQAKDIYIYFLGSGWAIEGATAQVDEQLATLPRGRVQTGQQVAQYLRDNKIGKRVINLTNLVPELAAIALDYSDNYSAPQS